MTEFFLYLNSNKICWFVRFSKKKENFILYHKKQSQISFNYIRIYFFVFSKFLYSVFFYMLAN
jgi:hypothetical protein